MSVPRNAVERFLDTAPSDSSTIPQPGLKGYWNGMANAIKRVWVGGKNKDGTEKISAWQQLKSAFTPSPSDKMWGGIDQKPPAGSPWYKRAAHGIGKALWYFPGTVLRIAGSVVQAVGAVAVGVVATVAAPVFTAVGAALYEGVVKGGLNILSAAGNIAYGGLQAAGGALQFAVGVLSIPIPGVSSLKLMGDGLSNIFDGGVRILEKGVGRGLVNGGLRVAAGAAVVAGAAYGGAVAAPFIATGVGIAAGAIASGAVATAGVATTVGGAAVLLGGAAVLGGMGATVDSMRSPSPKSSVQAIYQPQTTPSQSARLASQEPSQQRYETPAPQQQQTFTSQIRQSSLQGASSFNAFQLNESEMRKTNQVLNNTNHKIIRGETMNGIVLPKIVGPNPLLAAANHVEGFLSQPSLKLDMGAMDRTVATEQVKSMVAQFREKHPNLPLPSISVVIGGGPSQKLTDIVPGINNNLTSSQISLEPLTQQAVQPPVQAVEQSQTPQMVQQAAAHQQPQEIAKSAPKKHEDKAAPKDESIELQDLNIPDKPVATVPNEATSEATSEPVPQSSVKSVAPKEPDKPKEKFAAMEMQELAPPKQQLSAVASLSSPSQPEPLSSPQGANSAQASGHISTTQSAVQPKAQEPQPTSKKTGLFDDDQASATYGGAMFNPVTPTSSSSQQQKMKGLTSKLSELQAQNQLSDSSTQLTPGVASSKATTPPLQAHVTPKSPAAVTQPQTVTDHSLMADEQRDPLAGKPFKKK